MRFIKIDDLWVNPLNVLYVGTYRESGMETPGHKFKSMVHLSNNTVLASDMEPHDVAMALGDQL